MGALRFRYQEQDAVLLADIVNRNNVRMIQRRHRPSFLLETLPSLVVARHLRRQNLQRHLAL
jgi:hypothetical protein